MRSWRFWNDWFRRKADAGVKVAKICDSLSQFISLVTVNSFLRLFPYRGRTDAYARNMAMIFVGVTAPVIVPLYLISSYLERSGE